MSARIKIAHLTTVDATLRFLLLSHLKALQREGYAVAGISARGPWIGDLQREGIDHYAMPRLNRRWDPLGDVRVVVELARLFRRGGFTIVHTHAPKTGVLGRVAARLAGVPIVINTVHGLYGIDPRHPVRRQFFLALERLASRCSTFEFCQSREDLELLLRLGIVAPDRSAYLGNGVDLGYFDPHTLDASSLERLREELEIPLGSLVVGTVGRLVHEKGYREYIAAAAAVRITHRDVVFIAAGPDDVTKRDALRSDDVRAAAAQGVRFLGMRTDMRQIYGLLDVFVLASYREGFPRSAIEAAAMGKPLVLTDIRGCREVVSHGQNGFLVPTKQSAPLADAVRRLLDDPALRRRFGQESRRRALHEFDEQRVIDKVLAVYRDLLAKGNGAAAHALSTQSPVR
jgi:glycosyltransferase involved in cell wall biosynthesis